MSLPPQEIAYQTAHINEDQSPTIIGVCSFFTGLAVVTLAFRLGSRFVAKTKVGLDDYLAILAVFCLLGLNISACLVAHYGIGKHLLRVAADPQNFVRIGKTELAFAVFYDWSIAAAKLSICALLARIFTLNLRWFKIGVWFWATWTILWWIASWFITFLECRPLSTMWGDPYQCRPEYTTSVAAAVPNIISDAGILLLPQPLIWQLKATFRKKFAISLIFLLGIFATITSIVRIPLTKGANAGSDLDPTWTATAAIIFTVLEPAVAIICSNLPMTPRLLTSFQERLGSTFFRSSKKSHDASYGKYPGSSSNQSGSRSKDWIKLENTQTPQGQIKATTVVDVSESARTSPSGGTHYMA